MNATYRMPQYTQQQLLNRNKIISTQPIFGNFLDATLINTLIHLFDTQYNTYVNKNDKIIKYIEKERKLKGLSNADISIESELYGEKESKSTLFLIVKKNGKDLLHLSIHLSPAQLDPKDAGMIHISKNFYKQKVTKSKKKLMYGLIDVKQPISKTKSLEFSIADGYTTPHFQNAHMYNSEIQKEMDAIISVLNKLFDEDNKEMYIGNKLFPIHKKTNVVLENMNSSSSILTRKNRGVKINPNINNTQYNILNIIHSGKRTTRKLGK